MINHAKINHIHLLRLDIVTIKNYPDDGNHLECLTNFPFQIRKGEDGYHYHVKGKEMKYNLLKNKIDDRWIAHLTDQANESLENIFEIKCHKSLDVVLEYCFKMYKKSLQMELKRIEVELRYSAFLKSLKSLNPT